MLFDQDIELTKLEYCACTLLQFFCGFVAGGVVMNLWWLWQ